MKDPFASAEAGHTARRFGMTLFLISLGVLFAATVIGLVVVRIEITRKGDWPRDLPPLPRTLIFGTLVLIASSFAMQAALRSARRVGAGGGGGGSAARARTAQRLGVTTALGVLFILVQALGWLSWLSVVRERWAGSEPWRLALSGFYMLSGLHAAHVLGGLAALTVTWIRTRAAYDDARLPRAVLHCATYWHFLLGVWLVLYAFLMVLV